MVSTPEPRQVLPIVAPVAEHLRNALRTGIAYADDLQPDPVDRDPWFWSHAARFRALKHLKSKVEVESSDWSVRVGVPNAGIHLTFGDLHVSRVVRAFQGGTPHPGPNKARRRSWIGIPQLPLDTERGLQPLSLVIDWQNDAGEPVIHVGLPIRPWGYQKTAHLHWRVPLPEEGESIEDLSFEGDDGSGDGALLLRVDPTEVADDGG